MVQLCCAGYRVVSDLDTAVQGIGISFFSVPLLLCMGISGTDIVPAAVVQGITVSLILMQLLLSRVSGCPDVGAGNWFLPDVGAAGVVLGIGVSLILVQLLLCRVSGCP